ncbi:MAG: polysaccharide deacetylase family protein [Verrucomicrobia bacterium]|nr:polysaccharide deacetylase family protein [Verrucomicrobiota bacterium]
MNPRVKDLIRSTASACLHRTGATALRRRQLADDPRITLLTYHGVAAPNFEQHLRWLTARYRVVPLAEAAEWIRGRGRDEGRRVVITFDDGYKSFYRDLWPLLRKYRAPATLFAVSGFIGTDRLLWWDLIESLLRRATVREVVVRGQRWPLDYAALVAHAKTLKEPDKLRWIEELRAALGVELPQATGTEFELCTWDELRELAADPLVTVGGHTCTHPILSRVPAEVARQEIERDKAILEERLQRPIRFFAYPNGRATDFNDEHVGQLRAAGFECALTTVEGVCGRGADLFRLPRKNVGGRFTNGALACKLTGLWLSVG